MFTFMMICGAITMLGFAVGVIKIYNWVTGK